MLWRPAHDKAALVCTACFDGNYPFRWMIQFAPAKLMARTAGLRPRSRTTNTRLDSTTSTRSIDLKTVPIKGFCSQPMTVIAAFGGAPGTRTIALTTPRMGAHPPVTNQPCSKRSGLEGFPIGLPGLTILPTREVPRRPSMASTSTSDRRYTKARPCPSPARQCGHPSAHRRQDQATIHNARRAWSWWSLRQPGRLPLAVGPPGREPNLAAAPPFPLSSSTRTSKP